MTVHEFRELTDFDWRRRQRTFGGHHRLYALGATRRATTNPWIARPEAVAGAAAQQALPSF